MTLGHKPENGGRPQAAKTAPATEPGEPAALPVRSPPSAASQKLLAEPGRLARQADRAPSSAPSNAAHEDRTAEAAGTAKRDARQHRADAGDDDVARADGEYRFRRALPSDAEEHGRDRQRSR